MRLVLVGVPGAGKSTIIKKVQESIDVKVADFGGLMLEAAKKYGIRSRDEIRTKLTPSQFRNVRNKAVQIIAKMKGDVIIDTHVTVKTPLGYVPGIPNDIAKKLKLDVFVLLEFDPNDIHNRRKSDLTRKRDEETMESIDMQQHFNRYFASSAASETGAYIKIVSLRERQRIPYEHVQHAAREIIRILESNK